MRDRWLLGALLLLLAVTGARTAWGVRFHGPVQIIGEDGTEIILDARTVSGRAVLVVRGSGSTAAVDVDRGDVVVESWLGAGESVR